MAFLVAVVLAGLAPRPAFVVPLRTLWVATVAVQALDVHSTLRAVARGAQEGNPLVGGLVGRPWAFVAVKAGATVAVILATRQLAKRGHAKLAIGVLVVTTALEAVAVVHNYRSILAVRYQTTRTTSASRSQKWSGIP